MKNYYFIFIKVRYILASVINWFIPSCFLRSCVKEFFCFPHLKINRLSYKYNKRVNIAFCFNKNLVKVAKVTIISLLENSKNKCNYNIYCVIDNSVSEKDKKGYFNLMKKYSNNTLTFLYANNDFNKSYLGKWNVGIYYRLQLVKLLPNLDKIIYVDVDTVFLNDLSDADKIDLKDNIIAGVKDSDNYINSGFCIFNLKEIRKQKLYDKWIHLSQINKYNFPDQDLLNYTTQNKQKYISLKYNFIPSAYMENLRKLTYSKQDYKNIKNDITMIHFVGHAKPWRKDSVYSRFWKKYSSKKYLQ